MYLVTCYSNLTYVLRQKSHHHHIDNYEELNTFVVDQMSSNSEDMSFELNSYLTSVAVHVC